MSIINLILAVIIRIILENNPEKDVKIQVSRSDSVSILYPIGEWIVMIVVNNMQIMDSTEITSNAFPI
jgi:hypothetical protein